jgi:cell division septation protein DedD
MGDEGFHEIQLNGKQLVFLFMAATVVSVVIFLSGVMVGRGVNAARGPADAALQAADASENAQRSGEADAQSGSKPNEQPEAPAVDPSPVDEIDYHDRLVEGEQAESLGKPRRTPPDQQRTAPAQERATTARPDTAVPKALTAEPPRAVDRRAEQPEKPALPPEKPSPAPSTPERSAAPTSASGRYAVQLAALRERNEAEAIARRLVGKGYPAYVVMPEAGKPPVYRVQVGRFNSRGDADRTAARLRKEERFKPWVTR